MKISTSYDPKPVPMRGWDWNAVDEDTYDGEGSPIGWGATEQEAIFDLLEHLRWEASWK